jgi:hypothetical protein
MGTLYEQTIEVLNRMVDETRKLARQAAEHRRAVELMVLELGRQLAATEKAIERVDRLPARIIVIREGVRG